MVVALTGENSFGLQAELRRHTAEFVAEHGDLALERIDAEEAEFPHIAEALTSLPFLSSKKLVVLRAPGTNKIFAEKFEQLLTEVPETTDVILVEPKLDKRSLYYKYLKKLPNFREFAELDSNGLAKWLVDEAAQRGGSISAADARFLIERVGAQQQLLGNELEKLLLYASRHPELVSGSDSNQIPKQVRNDVKEESQITRQIIELLTDETPQSTIFQLLEAAFAGNRKRAMDLYQQQRALKVEPAQIIAMLTWQLHVLAILKTAGERDSGQIASDAKLNPFVVQKSQAIARKLSLAQLKTLVKNLLDIDAKSKRTNLDADEALQLYLLNLAN